MPSEQAERVIVVVFGILGVSIGFYILLWVLPYILFYAVPFILISTFVGATWAALCQIKETDYSRLAVLLPLTAIACFFIMGFPSEIKYSDDGKAILLESRSLFNAFNSVNEYLQGWIHAVGRAGLSSKKYHPTLYDWRNMAWIMWLSLVSGAPAVCLLHMAHLRVTSKNETEEKYKKLLSQKEAQLSIERAKAIKKLDEADNEIKRIEFERDSYYVEYLKIKQLLEFQRKGEIRSVREGLVQVKGILDSDTI